MIGGFQADLNTRATTTCLCFRIDRPDGESFYFTDHDIDVPFLGHTYAAATSFTASAIQEQLGLAVSNLDVLAAFDSAGITENDLNAGRFDGATLRVYLVNWLIPTKYTQLGRYTLGQVQAGDIAFQAELRSLAQHFAQQIGSLSTPKCRSPLFDTGRGLERGCNLARPAVVTGTIAAITDRKTFRVSAVGTFPNGTKGSLSGGYFAFGTVEFTSGDCDGIAVEVLNNDPSLNFTMRKPFPLDFQVGDSVEMQIGCDHTMPVCAGNYNNGANFRGEPYVPGTDKMFLVH